MKGNMKLLTLKPRNDYERRRQAMVFAFTAGVVFGALWVFGSLIIVALRKGWIRL